MKRKFSPLGYGHAVQQSSGGYKVFFHADRKLGASIEISSYVNESNLDKIFEEMDRTGPDYAKDN